MASSAEEAARALREIAEIKARAAGFQDYQAESGQLLVWGAAYFIGFALCAVLPGYVLGVWCAVVAVALLVGSGIARRTNPDIPGIAWRYLALMLGSIWSQSSARASSMPTVTLTTRPVTRSFT